MKVLSGVLALTLACQCLAAPAPVKDDYTELVETLLQYAKQEMSKHDPSTLPNIHNTIKNENISCAIVQLDARMSGSSIFVVEKIASHPANMSVEVVVVVPNINRNGNYAIAGEAYGKRVKGKGEFKVKMEGFKESVQVAFTNPERSLQIGSFNLTYELASIKMEMSGLTIEGMSPEEVQNFIDTEMTALFLRDLEKVASNTGRNMQRAFNPLIASKTLKEVVAWAKSKIDQ